MVTSKWPEPQLELPVLAYVEGNLTAGYWMPWFHRFSVTTAPMLSPIHYYEHTRRSRDAPQVLVPGGKHRIFTQLDLGTQVQSYRLAKNV